MLQKKIMWLFCAALLAIWPLFATAQITLDDAIARALAQSPRLQAFGSGVAVARSEQKQAGTWANPEISVEAENIAGNGAYSRLNSAEVTYGISQQFQLGGKISARKTIAGKGLEIARLEYQAAALDVIKEVTIAYAELIAAEENVRLATEQKQLADEVLRSVNLRVNAAAAPLIQQSRAEVERATAAIALDTALSERDIARKKFAAFFLGEKTLPFSLDNRAFYTIAKPTAGKPNTNPDLIKLTISLEQAKAQVDLEKANAIPDPRVNAGVRNFRDTGDQAFVLGVALPIPLFNSNRGNIEKARGEANKKQWENRALQLAINTDLIRAEQQMEQAYRRAEILTTQALPSASRAFSLARTGYGLGRFSYLEVLGAQRSLFEVKQQHIAALKEFHLAKAQAERLTATHLTSLQGATHAE